MDEEKEGSTVPSVKQEEPSGGESATALCES